MFVVLLSGQNHVSIKSLRGGAGAWSEVNVLSYMM